MIQQGDAIDLMRALPDASVDAIITDPPYGITRLAWDTKVDWVAFWREAKRICPDGPHIVFGAQPFTTDLIGSNREAFRFCWYWYKNNPTGFAFANKQPMRAIEEVCVFGTARYNKMRMVSRITDRRLNVPNGTFNGSGDKHSGAALKPKKKDNPYNMLKELPSAWNVLEIPVAPRAKGLLHPTQKPIDLMAWLILAHTKPDELVLDPFAGSGTTGVAALREGRRFLGFEREQEYAAVASRRLENVQPSAMLE